MRKEFGRKRKKGKDTNGIKDGTMGFQQKEEDRH